jgi:hypothetical protein
LLFFCLDAWFPLACGYVLNIASKHACERLATMLSQFLSTVLARWLILEALPHIRGEPLLEVMYLKYLNEPIDTTPVFNPMVPMYVATLDWKMKFFAVEAKPVAPAIIDNIHLCRDNADCLKEDQRVVPMDFSKKIPVEPGNMVKYMFDVLLQGVVKSYTLDVKRLEGSETTVRNIFALGVTLSPAFDENMREYSILMDVTMEMVRFEIHLLDSGQTVFAEADYPSPLDDHDSITELKNEHPGNFRSPPMRRMREEAFGEFQYPNKYLDFPVPLEHTRVIHIKVMSADAGHNGIYTLKIARGRCPTSEPLFDGEISKCVKFCNVGFYADFGAGRCKRCQESCVNCLSLRECVQCKKPDRTFYYVKQNATGECLRMERALWVQHPEQVVAIIVAFLALCVFCCGMCAFLRLAFREKKPRGINGQRQTHGTRNSGGNGYAYTPVETNDYH